DGGRTNPGNGTQRIAASCQRMDRDTGRGDQAGDESAAWLVVASPEEPQGERDRQRQEDASTETEDDRTHDELSEFRSAVPFRRAETLAIRAVADSAVSASTEISPSVSRAR